MIRREAAHQFGSSLFYLVTYRLPYFFPDICPSTVQLRFFSRFKKVFVAALYNFIFEIIQITGDVGTGDLSTDR